MRQSRHKILTLFLAAIGLVTSPLVASELIVPTGNFTTAGTVDGDLIVAQGSINIAAGDLVVNGDVKVLGGKVDVTSGNLVVEGDLIVTNTNLVNNFDASVSVTGDIRVTGAIITQSSQGRAYVYAEDPGSTGDGNLGAGRISTNGKSNAYVHVDHNITVTGSIVTKSTEGDAYVYSDGKTPYYGNIFAGSICTYAGNSAAGNGDAYVWSKEGYLISYGPIITYATDSSAAARAFVKAEGQVVASRVSTYGRTDAYVQGERVDVEGDIITESSWGDGHVSSVYAFILYGDVTAESIYTTGSTSAYVTSANDVNVVGDVVTTCSIPGSSGTAYISADSSVYAQNVLPYGDGNAYIFAQDEIKITGEVITKSDSGDAYVYASGGELSAYNISTYGRADSDVYVKSNDNKITVTRTIRTDNANESGSAPWGGAYVYSSANNVKATKIFTDGTGDSSVTSSKDILVKGPIVVQSEYDKSIVSALLGIEAGLISTDGYNDASVTATGSSITVREEIRTQSSNSDAKVTATSGNLVARSIKTVAPVAQDDSIQAAAGSAEFQFFSGGSDLLIKDAKFDFNRDYEWNNLVSLQGTCTINGRGHQLNFGSNGGLLVTSGSKLFLQDILLRNIGGESIRCQDNTATFSLFNVVWSQTADYLFKNGDMHIVGDVLVTGSGTSFVYESTATSSIHSYAELRFDSGVTFSYNTGDANRFGMVDSSSRLAFDNSVLHAQEDVRLMKGTLVLDNVVTFTALSGKTIYIGNNVNSEDNLLFEFHQQSKLKNVGNLVYTNV